MSLLILPTPAAPRRVHSGLRSRFEKILHVPQRVRLRFFSPAALRGKQRVSARLGRADVIDDHFEHPKRMLQGNEQWV